MKKLLTIKSLGLLVLILILSIGVTYAWIIHFQEINGSTVHAGEINYDYSGAFINETEIIYPGLNLIDQTISVNNQSTINTQLRLKIDYTYIGESVYTKTYINEVDDDLIVGFSESFINDGDYWYYHSDEYVIDYTGVFNLISNLAYDGNSSSNEYANQSIQIEVLIQVKQADHVAWEDLGTIDFSTGN